MLNLSFSGLLANAIALLVGFAVHEASHAFVAYRLGDDTAKRSGRLTLNPVAHLDPMGALFALLAGFGWAKPVPVNPWRLRYGPRVGNALVAAAGPASNLVLAALVSIPIRLGVLDGAPQLVQTIAWTLMALNLALCVFNLIPLGPLDGVSVLAGLVGAQYAGRLRPLQTWGPQILMALFMFGFFFPQVNILGSVLWPAVRGLERLLLGY